MDSISFLSKAYIGILLPRRNTLVYSLQVQYRQSNLCFKIHQQLWSLLGVEQWLPFL